MKTPRIQDFDPTAKPPALSSPMEGMPHIEKPKAPEPHHKLTRTPERPLGPISERPNAPTPVASFARTSVRPNGKRIITRNSFEVYEDQMDALRKISLEEKMEGKLGSMSQMVREAIDAYLEKRRGK